LNSFRAGDFRAAEGRAVGVGQQQAHRLYVAGVTQFAEFLGKPPAVHGLAQDCT